MRFRRATVNDIWTVVRNMRESDAEEQFLCSDWSVDRIALAERLSTPRDDVLAHIALAGEDDAAIALVGAWEVTPGVATVHQVATARWPEIGRAAHRFYHRWFIPTVLEPTIRLAEVRLLPRSVRWVTALGFRPVTPPLPYGREGELLVTCVWINPEHRRP